MDRMGVFICSGCGIEKAIDIESLANVVKKNGGIVCITHKELCSAVALSESIDIITKDCLDSVLIVACSVRWKKESFSPLQHNVVLRRVGIREQLALNRDERQEDVQAVAEDQLIMGMAALKMERRSKSCPIEVNRSVLVAGAGLCGLVAAESVARLGYHVYLVEKEAEPGGFLRNIKSVAPWQSPFDKSADNPVGDWLAAITGSQSVTIMTSTEIKSISGQPGQFTVDTGDTKFNIGAIIQATGASPVSKKALMDLYNIDCSDVISGFDFEQMLASAGSLKKPSNGAVPKTIVFIQCAGSREELGLPYCSRECCQITLKQIHQIQKMISGVECLVVYRDMRTNGFMEMFYAATLSLENVSMIRGEVQRIEMTGGNTTLFVESTVIGDNLQIHADIVVLATGMVPCSTDGEALRIIRNAEQIIQKNESQQQVAYANEQLHTLAHLNKPSILHLDYRQGPDLPQLAYGFPDSHFICFPYETRRTGIYAAGTVRAPMDIAMGIADAKGAALMAVTCVEATARGESVLPRTADTETAEFFMQRCTQCKRCTEECPYGALNEDEKGTPLYFSTRCRRCGVCLGACPERIVSFDSYSVDIVAAMIKASDIPDEFEEKPRILVFTCENDAAPALDNAAQLGMNISPWIRFIEIRCLGAFHNVWIADALSRGYDGVLLMGCRQGDDYQCHNITGSAITHTRISNISETLERLAIEKERVRIVEVGRDESAHACRLIAQFVSDVEALGPNPLKAF